MTEEKYKYLPISENQTELNLKDLVDKYKKHWPWFMACVLLFSALAIIYIKYAPREFTSTASIIVKDQENDQKSRGVNGFEVNLLNGLSTNSMANELGLLTSKRLMYNTVKALDLNVEYLDDTEFIEKPLYEQSPVKLQILRLDEGLLRNAINNKNHVYRIKNNSPDGFQVINEETENIINTNFNTPVEFDFVDFVIQENSNLTENIGWTEILVKFSTFENAAARFSRVLEVDLLDEQSTLIQLKLNTRVPKKGNDILNQLIFEYNKEAIEDKNLIAKNTADFINERLNIISGELDSVETGKESYKETNRLMDINAESQIMMQNVSEYNQQRQQVETQLEVATSMLNYMDSGESNLLPANLGLESSASAFVNDYNSLVIERNRLLAASTEQNPRVIQMNEQIEELKNNVKQSLITQRQSLLINQDNLRKRAGALGSQLSMLPGMERQVRGIERQQSIKESLYLYLLQKREENTLELSVTGPKAKIVDSAWNSEGNISPSPKIALGGAIILGFLLPFLFIRGKELLNDKIQSKDDLEKLSRDIPIVGELPSLGKSNINFIKENDRSTLSEAFRILSANMQYLNIENKPESRGTSIFVTSTIQGEGKTFVATNLAITLALTGKKIILVGGDLRNPQLQRYQKGLKNVLGVSDFLINKKQELQHLYQVSELNENLIILPSGTIPPNPAELLQSKRLKDMFTILESQFDYVVVDTAPSLLIADTFLINKYATLTLYVVRTNFTKHKLMDFVNEAKSSGKLKNMSLVLNDVPLSNLGYGSKYGYSYKE